MSCSSHFEEQIALAVGGDLAPDEQIQLDAHLSDCVDCRAFAEEMALSQEALVSLASEEIPAAALHQVRQQLSQQLEARPSRRTLNAPLRWAAVIALAWTAAWWMRSVEGPFPVSIANAPAANGSTPITPAPVNPASTDPVPVDSAAVAPVAVASVAVASILVDSTAESPPASSPSPREAIDIARAQIEPELSRLEPEAADPPPAATVSEPVKTAAAQLPGEQRGLGQVPPEPESPAIGEPIVVQWISEDPDLVIYWLVDTEPEEEALHVPSKV